MRRTYIAMTMAAALWACGDDDSTGAQVGTGGGVYTDTTSADGLWDAPTAYDFTCTYRTGVQFRVANNKKLGFMGAKWHGEGGWIHVWRGGLKASDPKILAEDVLPRSDFKLYDGNEGRDHVDNFLDCIRSRQKTITPVETACRSISVGHLGEIAMLTGRKIRWNPETEEILGDPGASALLGRAYREPWVL